MQDGLGLCVFGYAPRGVMPLDKMVRCLNAITGWNASLFELMKAAERGTTMARAFNSREGFTIKDDRLPKRFYDPKPDGPKGKVKVFEEKDFNQAIRRFMMSSVATPGQVVPAGASSSSWVWNG